MPNTSALRAEAEQDAADALARAGYTELFNMPVDATRVAELNGANVFADDLDDEDLDGFVLITGANAEITINQNRAYHRRRFTCAHELGHVVQETKLRRSDKVGYLDDDSTLDDGAPQPVLRMRDQTARDGTQPAEIYANHFAAALLMPEPLVRVLHNAAQSPTQMAKFFRVSNEAMAIRLTNLGLMGS